MSEDEAVMNIQDGSSGVCVTCPARRRMKWTTMAVTEEIPQIKNHTATLDGKSLYIFGGYDGKRNHNDLYVLDVDSFKWTRPEVSGPAPEGRNGHTATLVGRRMFILGGWLGSGPLAAHDLHVLDLDLMAWVPSHVDGEPPGPCNMHTSDLVPGDKVLVFRGGDGMNYLNDLHALDVKEMRWRTLYASGQVPPPRANHSSAVDDAKLYVFGGWDGARRLNDLHVLDSDTMIWTRPEVKGGVPPAPRAGMSLTYVRGQLFLFGGSGHATKCFNDLHVYDPKAGVWWCPQLADVPDRRAGHVAARADRRLVIFGGSFSATYFRDCHILDSDPPPEMLVAQEGSLEAMRHSMASFYNSQTFSDVAFEVEGRIFPAHKLVLSLYPSKFKAMLTSGMKETYEDVIQLPNIRYDTFAAMMGYLYTGELRLPPKASSDLHAMLELLMAADEFMLDGVKDQMEGHMVSLVTTENAGWLLDRAALCQSRHLEAYCEWLLRETDRL